MEPSKTAYSKVYHVTRSMSDVDGKSSDHLHRAQKVAHKARRLKLDMEAEVKWVHLLRNDVFTSKPRMEEMDKGSAGYA